MREIMIVFKETEESREIDFRCLLCGEYYVVEGRVIEVRDQRDNNQLIGCYL